MKHSILLVFAALALCQAAFAGQLYILDVANESTIPSPVYAGDLVTLTLDVKNISGSGQDASDINVSIELNSNDFEEVKVSEMIGALKAQGSKTVSLRFRIKETALPGSYKISVFLNYKNALTKISQSDDINIKVETCSILKVDDIALSTSTPHNNSVLSISASIKNICSAPARDVSVELKPQTNTTIAPFIVASGTSKKLGDIGPNSSKSADFSIEVSNDVEAKAYVFSIDANCDGCSKAFSNSFSFLVQGAPELVFSNIEYSVDDATSNDKEILLGNNFTLSVQLDNIGKEKAKAVEVSTDFGTAIVGTSKSFLGNIDQDDSGAAIFNLKAFAQAKPGKHEGTITVSYIDETGQRQQIVEQYSLYVSEAPAPSPVLYIIILVLLIAALGIVYFIVKFVFRQLAIRKSQSR